MEQAKSAVDVALDALEKYLLQMVQSAQQGAVVQRAIDDLRCERAELLAVRKALESRLAQMEQVVRRRVNEELRLLRPQLECQVRRERQRLARPNGSRWVVERTLSWLNRFRRLQVRYERRTDIHQAFLTFGRALICWRELMAGEHSAQGDRGVGALSAPWSMVTGRLVTGRWSAGVRRWRD
jgi:transposase